MRQSVLSKAFAVSLLLHAGLVGLLMLEASRRPLLADTPLRVRILEPPASQGTTPAAPQPPPDVPVRPKAGRGPVEASRPGSQMAKPQPPTVTERLAPRPTPVPDRPAVPDKTEAPAPVPQAAAPPLPEPAAARLERLPEAPREAPAPPSQVAALPVPKSAAPPLPEPAAPRLERLPEAPREAPAPPSQVAALPVPKSAAPPLPEPAAARLERLPEAPREAPAPTARGPTTPERGGLILGGPSQAVPSLPGAKGAPPASGPARPSLREQIASLSSELADDLGGTAKRTISLDSREEHFVEYLARLKRRIQRLWEYPEEAVKHGISGELLILFTLNRAGSLTYIRLAQSSGYPVLDEEALRAVKVSAPFDPFLAQMGDEPLNISASFYYDLPRRLRRN